MRVPNSQHSCQPLLLSTFLIIVVLVGVKGCLVVLICIFLMTNAVEVFSCAHWPLYILCVLGGGHVRDEVGMALLGLFTF